MKKFLISTDLHFIQELFTWDHGNQLTYPVRYNDMTKFTSASERAEETFNAHTGYENDD